MIDFELPQPSSQETLKSYEVQLTGVWTFVSDTGDERTCFVEREKNYTFRSSLFLSKISNEGSRLPLMVQNDRLPYASSLHLPQLASRRPRLPFQPLPDSNFLPLPKVPIRLHLR